MEIKRMFRMEREVYQKLMDLISDGEVAIRKQKSKHGVEMVSLSKGDIEVYANTACDAVNKLWDSLNEKKDEVVINGVVYVPKVDNCTTLENKIK